MPVERVGELPAAELRPAVGVQDTAGNISASLLTASNRVVQRFDGKPGLHPRVDQVANDPVEVGVLDRTKIQLALPGPVLGDVREPPLVQSLCTELVADYGVPISHRAEVVADLRTELLAVVAASLPERRPPALP